MKSFITFDDINRIRGEVRFSQLLEKAKTASVYSSTFLSYSNKDDDYLPGIINVLENHGATVYIDKKDVRLPITPNTETASILRDSLNKASKFVLFVTPNSKESKWIPWELGIADGCKNESNLALFPAAQYSYDQEWSEQEYLGLYRRIIWGNFENHDPEWLVYNHHDNTATELRKWLKN